MSAQELATMHIKSELERQSKCFIAFRTELNPIMKHLVRKQITAQRKSKSYDYTPTRELIATCFFSKTTGKADYVNYRRHNKRK